VGREIRGMRARVDMKYHETSMKVRPPVAAIDVKPP